ncbi:MAG: GNAT family N-acetyltransferase [Myxococcota bacterium]
MKATLIPYQALHRDDLYAVMALRQEVFVVEQDCPYLDADGLDAQAHHLLMHDDHGLAAYLRIFAPGICHATHIVVGRVVTSPRIRGTGWGRPLMKRGMDEAWTLWGPHPIHISAQAHLRPYYESLGFVVNGEGYLEDGIPHLPMDCAPPAPADG